MEESKWGVGGHHHSPSHSLAFNYQNNLDEQLHTGYLDQTQTSHEPHLNIQI